MTIREKVINTLSQNISLYVAVFFAVAYFIFLQFLSPALYGTDSYYHVAVARFIKDHGPRYDFHWAQFSTFKDFFSDKDFLFHLLITPFTCFSKNIALTAKSAAIVFNIAFVCAYVFILRKYVTPFLAAIFLILPWFSSTFSIYSLYLRSSVLANILTIGCIYFLINKKGVAVFVATILYSLTHISFFTIIFFAFLCEGIRYLQQKEFFRGNLYAVVFGSVLGCFIHPNYPHNLFSLHLNAFLVPLYALNNTGLELGRELSSLPMRYTFLGNFAVFFSTGMIFCLLLCSRIKANLSTYIWGCCAFFYFVLGFLSNRYWYQVNILFFIFCASLINDWGWESVRKNFSRRINIFFVFYFAIIFIASPASFDIFKGYLNGQMQRHIYYEDIGRWMNKNIPAGETVYHAAWGDSPAFICLNPKNNYLVVLDPVYMYRLSPKGYFLYRDLKHGRISDPRGALRNIFKTRYGFVGRDLALCGQIKRDAANFRILYENRIGIVFEVK